MAPAPYLLVVESDPELQRRIGEALKEAHYELAAEADVTWAKRSLLVRTPDALVVDTSLSDGSGFLVADELRKDPDAAQVPIFFVGSRFRGQSHETEIRRRFTPAELLPAPLDPNTLLARVLETLPPGPPRPRTVEPPPPAPHAEKLADAASRQEKRQVEQDARSFGTGDPELSGSLDRQPFARVLQRIYARRLTGALLVARKDAKKIVYFRDGYPVSARSNVLAECLGQILVSRKLITDDALAESLRRMKAEKKQQGAVLVEMGLLSPYRLSRALVEQMEAKLLDMFGWTAGQFTFKEGQESTGEPVSLERTTAALILEGIRTTYDDIRQAAVLRPYQGQYVVPSADPLRRLQGMTADAAELAFIESIDGSKKLEAILAGKALAPEKARLLLVAMAEAGMIEPARLGTKKGGDDGGAPEPALRPPRSRSELSALLEAKKAQTHFEVLEIDEDAGDAAVSAGYERLAREFHPDRYRTRSEEVRVLAQRIFDRLGEAHAVLTDPARRKSYVSRVDKLRSSSRGRDGGAGIAAEQVYWTGVEHLRARRYEQAAEAFRQATGLAPGQAGYHGALGWAIYRQAPADKRASDAALAELKRAVSLDDKDPWIRVSLGRFYAETGKADLAIEAFEAALALSPGLADIEDEIRRLKGQS